MCAFPHGPPYCFRLFHVTTRYKCLKVFFSLSLSTTDCVPTVFLGITMRGETLIQNRKQRARPWRRTSLRRRASSRRRASPRRRASSRRRTSKTERLSHQKRVIQCLLGLGIRRRSRLFLENIGVFCVITPESSRKSCSCRRFRSNPFPPWPPGRLVLVFAATRSEMALRSVLV